MKKLVLSAFVIAAISFTSCNNDDNVGGENIDITKMYLPLKMTSDGYTTTFAYNSKGQVTKISDSDGYEYVFTYNGNQLTEFSLTQTSGTSVIKDVYTYSQSGNTITVTVKNNDNTDTNTLTVDDKGNLISDGYYTYTYDATGNNITRSVEEEGAEGVFTYDNKNGIFKNLNLPKWISNYFFGFENNVVNNALSFKYESVEDPEDNVTGTAVYQYNADGYPVKSTTTFTDDTGTNVETQTIEYTKK